MLDQSSVLELHRRAVSKRFVQSDGVEPADVLDDRELKLRAGAPDAVGDQLGLEGVDEALSERVVERIADRADRGEHAMVVEYLGEGVAVYWLPASE